MRIEMRSTSMFQNFKDAQKISKIEPENLL